MCGISGIYNSFNKDINSRRIIEKIIKSKKLINPQNLSEINDPNFLIL